MHYNPYFFLDILHRLMPAILAILLFIALFQLYKFVGRRLGGSDSNVMNAVILLFFVVAFLGGVWAILQVFPAVRVVRANLVLW